MDQKLVDQSIDYHGPELVDGLYKEQVNVKLPNFLTLPQNSKNKEIPKNIDFEKMVISFVSKKADLIFKTKEKKEKKTFKEDGESFSDHLTRLPPLEYFMDVQNEHRKEHYNKSVERGDIVIGAVAAVQQQGLLIHLICLDDNKSRDIKQLKIAAFCPSRELPKLYAHESPIDAFAIRDKVRGIVTSVSKDKDVVLVIISLLQDKYPQNQPPVKIGLISDEELPEYFKHMKEGRIGNYRRELIKSRGFSNPSNVTTLTNMFDIDESMAPSLMRGLHSIEYNKTDFAEELRKTQSYRLALKSVAEGVDFFKKGKHVEAMQHLNKALEIDSENVEGLVARGALYANNESYSRAIEDFEKALEINPNHNNAKTYMSETLLVHARGLMDQNMEREAAVYLEKVLKLNPDLKEAQRVLGEIKKKIAEQERSPEPVVVTDSEPEDVIDEKSLIQKTADTLRMIMEEEDSNRRKKKKKLCSPESSRSEVSRRDSVLIGDKREKTTSRDVGTEFQKMVSKHAPLSPGTEAFIKSKFEEEKARSLGLDYINPESKRKSNHLSDEGARYSKPENVPEIRNFDQNERLSNYHSAYGYSDRVEKNESYPTNLGHGDDLYEKKASMDYRGYVHIEDKGDGNYKQNFGKSSDYYKQDVERFESFETDARSPKEDFELRDRKESFDIRDKRSRRLSREEKSYKEDYETEDRSYGQSISFHEIMEQFQENEKNEGLVLGQSLYDRKDLEDDGGSSGRKGSELLLKQNISKSDSDTWKEKVDRFVSMQNENTSDADAWKDQVNQFVSMLQNKHKKTENWTDPNKPQVARIKPLQTAPSNTGSISSRSPQNDRYTGRLRSRSRSPDRVRRHSGRSNSPGIDRYTGKHREKSKSPDKTSHTDRSNSRDRTRHPSKGSEKSRSPESAKRTGKHNDRSRSRDSSRHSGRQIDRSRSPRKQGDRSRSSSSNKVTLSSQQKTKSSDKILSKNRSRSPEKERGSGKKENSQRSSKCSPSSGKSSDKKDRNRKSSPKSGKYSDKKDQKKRSRSKSPSQSKTNKKGEKELKVSTSQRDSSKITTSQNRNEKLVKDMTHQRSMASEGCKEKDVSNENTGKVSITDRLKRLSQLEVGHDLNKQTVKMNLSSLTEKITAMIKNDKKDKELTKSLSKTSRERKVSPKLTVTLKRKSSGDFSQSGESNKKTKTQDYFDVKMNEKRKDFEKISHDLKPTERSRDRERSDCPTFDRTQSKDRMSHDRKRSREIDRSDRNQSKKDKRYSLDTNYKIQDCHVSEKRRHSEKFDSPETKRTKLMKSKWDRDSSSDESEKERKQQKSDQVKETLAEMEGFLQMLKTNKKKKSK